MLEVTKKITFKKRIDIENLYKKLSVADMSKVLGISEDALFREIARCPSGKYNAEEAESDARIKRYHKNRTKDSIKRMHSACAVALLSDIDVRNLRKYYENEVEKELQEKRE